MRRGPGSLYRRFKSVAYLATRDRDAALDFLRAARPASPLRDRLDLLRRFVAVTNAVRGYHTLAEMLADPELLKPPEAVIPRLAWKGRLTLLPGREKLEELYTRLGEITKAALAHTHIFEHFGLLCVGPVDGESRRRWARWRCSPGRAPW